MPFAVKQDEPAHPLHVLHLRADAVMLDTHSVKHLIEQLRTLPHGGVWWRHMSTYNFKQISKIIRL
jgi:DNA-binding NarL/FixJ family response regulator